MDFSKLSLDLTINMQNVLNFSENIRNLSLIFGSQILAFIIAVIIAPTFIQLLKKYKIGKQLRDKATTGEKAVIFNELHAKKKGTPTMGGILIWGTVLIVVLLSSLSQLLGITENSLFSREETLLPIATLIATAILGAVDDYMNLKGQGKNKGINVNPKFFLLTLFALLGALWFYYRLGYESIHIPMFGDFNIGIWYIPLFIFIITATSNAVNITDGLDGLAGGLLIIAFTTFAALAYASGLFVLAAFCMVITGALLGFLWFNIMPAKFYMGDTGSIALGATLGVIAMMTDSMLVLPLIGFIFVIETLSVIIQIFSKKFFKKKVFLIAPIHHHFEKKGWHEATVVMRFWIIGGFVAVIGMIVGLV
ncbi:phospho-N-acetylmuramoyl-pentapeptide-transferase [Candidatus Peregrinibacteria bacterium]|nr:phospho-N-acetylmuramoyl-pentapeptide-transferase [Candidatus Peregrinibacteria bacterium]